ncbi:MAG: hypothetical protein HQ567_33845 [Candidatus Nealsonbacteria bacterium]|nr:hypothetical protein [Candidatus Nealsonbacteria bacterium]
MSTPSDGFRGLTPPGSTVGQLLVPLVLVAATVDVIVPMIVRNARSPVLGGIFLGVLLAQLGLLNVWAVLGSQRLLVRWTSALLVGWFLYGSIILGTAISSGIPNGGLEIPLRMAALLPGVFICVQLPLWGLKAITGGRLVLSDDERVPATELRQFGLQQMLTVTTGVALTLGLARLGLPELDALPDQAWFALSLTCGFCFVGALLTVLPCVCAIFLPRNLDSGVAIGVAYAFTLAILVILVIGITSGGNVPSEAFVALFAFAFGLMGTQLGILSMLRMRGYRLQRVSRKPSPGAAELATGCDEPGTSPFDDESAQS